MQIFGDMFWRLVNIHDYLSPYLAFVLRHIYPQLLQLCGHNNEIRRVKLMHRETRGISVCSHY